MSWNGGQTSYGQDLISSATTTSSSSSSSATTTASTANDVYNLQNKARSLPALGNSSRSFAGDEDDEVASEIDSFEKSASWACGRDDMNYPPSYAPYYQSNNNAGGGGGGTMPMFEPQQYHPQHNHNHGNFPRGIWQQSQPQPVKSPSLLFTVRPPPLPSLTSPRPIGSI
jgi:hypothetical protein